MLHFQISSLVNVNESINGSFLDSRWLVIEEASSRNSNNELILGLKSIELRGNTPTGDYASEL
jgi:hypothetical protein